MSRRGSGSIDGEAQSKSLQERLTVTENHLGQVCEIMSSYTRKIAKMRDKGDMLAKVLKDYASLETMNPCLKRSLVEFADEMSLVQDYREAEVKRLETKVVHPLSNYGLLCKQTKNELKAAFSARDKELNQKKKLDKTRSRNPRDRGTISQAEMELQKASIDASRSSKALEQQLEKFELRKLEDFKKILTDFVNVEMIFHAKALEVYTRCFSSLAVMDPEADLEEFRSHMYPLSGSDRMSMARTASLNSLSQNGSGSVEVTPRHSRQGSTQGSTQGSVSLGRQMSLPSPASTPSSARHHPPSANPSPAHTPSRRASTSSEQRSSRTLPPQQASSQPAVSASSQPPKQGGTPASARPTSAATTAKREEARAVQPAQKEEEEEEDSDEYEDDEDEDDDEEEDEEEDDEEEEEDDGISELTEVKPMSGRPIMVVSSNSSTKR